MHRQRFARSNPRFARLNLVSVGILLATAVPFTSGCTPSPSEVRTTEESESDDRAFTALQARGKQAMGVDQYTSTHVFDALPDGGRIELQRDVDDPAGVDHIRHHLRRIAEAFASGDFSTPAFVHLREVPGTTVMAAKNDRIEYVYRELPRGAELRLVTNDPEALRAIHEFMASQREEHRAGGLRPGAAGHSSVHHRGGTP